MIDESYLKRKIRWPRPFDRVRAENLIGDLEGTAPALLRSEASRTLITAIAGNSPFLARQIGREPQWLEAILAAPPERGLARILSAMAEGMQRAQDLDDAMRILRRGKAEGALLAAVADIACAWDWVPVTAAISSIAETATEEALRFALRAEAAKGRFLPRHKDEPERDSGLIVLGMGKLGARELNYSSDIDFTVFYERETLPLAEGVEPGPFAVRLTQMLVKMLQEPTQDGYVFRVDLRLRPDAGATQIAVSTEAAEYYYESLGQNWERAAMIKARPIAGDKEAGERFLKMLSPFIFRKHLDYAAIEDIHSIKRQIHAHEGHSLVRVRGHNIKLGRGGIREIEFFVQTQQLILGGRDSGLRGRRSIDMLQALAQRGAIATKVEAELSEAYGFLRMLEHRLQMIEDQQVHSLPEDDAGLAHIAAFMGFPDFAHFEQALRRRLETVQGHYAALFESAPPLAKAQGSLVFTGVDDDPETIATLRSLGFTRPSDVAATIRGWHHGRVRAMRSERAREKLTALTPALLDALSATASPDHAFAGFDTFLSGLPSGIQVFSLLYANPSLLGVLAEAFGTAPLLAVHLARRPILLDALLDANFLARLPDAGELASSLEAVLAGTPNFEETLDRIRRWQKEQVLRVGLQVIRGRIEARMAGPAFADIAETVIRKLLPAVEEDIARQHGRIKNGAWCVLGLGKLGGREMTAASDLDLIAVYDCPLDAASEGGRPLPASQYYARLTQRLIAGLTSLTAEGRLYDVDMRLRPSGSKGPVATHLESFRAYHKDEAWTWERMALTRARLIAGNEALGRKVMEIVQAALRERRDPAEVRKDIAEMRERVAKEYPSNDAWELKYVRGGLLDLEFMAQALQLEFASSAPGILSTATIGAFEQARRLGKLPAQTGAELIAAAALIQTLTQVLRIALDGPAAAEKLSPGLRAAIARACGEKDWPAVDATLRTTLNKVRAHCASLLGA